MGKKTRAVSSDTILEYLPMVRYWARHYAHRRHRVLDFDDLVVVGLMGLMDALQRYRPERNAHFKSYAEFRVRGEIVDELRRQDWMSRTERRKQKDYQSAQNKLGHALGRTPTRMEMAKVTPLAGPDLDRMAQYEEHDSIRSYLEGDLGQELRLEDSVALSVERHDEVAKLMEPLSVPMRTIVEMRYYQDASVEEIAAIIGVSLGRVSQLHAEALELMREESAA